MAETALLQALAATAQDILAGYLACPVGEVNVVDFYGGTACRLELSSRVKDAAAVVVSVTVAGDDTEQAGFVVDTTTDPPAVVFPADHVFPAPDPRFLHPVKAAYKGAAYAGAGVEGLQHAIKVLVQDGFHHGGDAMSDTKTVQRAVRFLTGRARAASPGRIHS